MVLPLRGWCYSADGLLQSLEVVAGGRVTPIPNHSWGRTDIFVQHVPTLDPSGNSLLSGFEGFVPLEPAEAAEAELALLLRATL